MGAPVGTRVPAVRLFGARGQQRRVVHRGLHRRLGEDAEAAITALTEGPVVLVGSSMGGWISLLLAKRMPEKLAGLVTIAAAPDFTEDGMWGAGPRSSARR
jgi:pimeloyl-ACP methyl ester carboxylesterase